jgi:hypothetical protein
MRLEFFPCNAERTAQSPLHLFAAAWCSERRLSNLIQLAILSVLPFGLPLGTNAEHHVRNRSREPFASSSRDTLLWAWTAWRFQ